MTVWFLFIAGFCLAGFVVGVGATSKRGAPFWLGIVAGALAALPGLALGLFGFALVRLGKRRSKADVDQIVEHVKSTLAGNVV